MNIFPLAVPNFSLCLLISVSPFKLAAMIYIYDRSGFLRKGYDTTLVQYKWYYRREEDYPMPRRHSNDAGTVSSGVSNQPFFPFTAPPNHSAVIFQTFTMMLAISAQAARAKKYAQPHTSAPVLLQFQ